MVERKELLLWLISGLLNSAVLQPLELTHEYGMDRLHHQRKRHLFHQSHP
jgi:hypothetical protein